MKRAIDATSFSLVSEMYVVLLIVYSIITNNRSDKEKLICACINFRKAFDTILNTFLWSKLLKYGDGNRCSCCWFLLGFF